MRFIVERSRLTPELPLPASTAAIIEHMRLTEDELLEAQRLVFAAMREIEHHGQLALFDQTITLRGPSLDRRLWTGLPIGPVASAPNLTLEGAAHVLTADRWADLPDDLAARLPLSQPFVLTYRAGFGTEAADLPEDLVLAVLDQAAAYYDARGAADGKVLSLSPHAARIAARYRGVRL